MIIHATPNHFPDIINMNRREYWNDEEYSRLSIIKKFDLGSWWVEKEWLDWHYSILKKCNGGILLWIEDGEILGQLDYIQSPNYLAGEFIENIHIVWLLVKKSARKLGIAFKLITYLKENFPRMDIVVDPEDHRSEKLYRKFSDPYSYYLNYRISLKQENFPNLKISKSKIKYSELVNGIWTGEFAIEIGRYYSPLFDILQLNYGEPVKELVWGEYTKPEIFAYSLEGSTLVAILTPYIRIFNSISSDNKHTRELVLYIFRDLAHLGFNEVYLQIFQNDYFSEIVQSIDAILISDNDPVFRF